MWNSMNRELKILFSIWLVFLHLFFAGLIYLYFDVTGGMGIGSSLETPTPLQMPTPLGMTALAERLDMMALDERAVNEHGESPPSGKAVIRNGVPNAPTGLWAELQPGNEADLGWDASASSYVTGYRVERKTGSGAWVTIKDNLSTEYLNSTDWNLQSGTTYTYTVIAVNEHGESAPSAPYVLRVP